MKTKATVVRLQLTRQLTAFSGFGFETGWQFRFVEGGGEEKDVPHLVPVCPSRPGYNIINTGLHTQPLFDAYPNMISSLILEATILELKSVDDTYHTSGRAAGHARVIPDDATGNAGDHPSSTR